MLDFKKRYMIYLYCQKGNDIIKLKGVNKQMKKALKTIYQYRYMILTLLLIIICVVSQLQYAN